MNNLLDTIQNNIDNSVLPVCRPISGRSNVLNFDLFLINTGILKGLAIQVSPYYKTFKYQFSNIELRTYEDPAHGHFLFFGIPINAIQISQIQFSILKIFIEAIKDPTDKKRLLDDPYSWCDDISEQLGNSNSNKKVKAILAELIVLKDLFELYNKSQLQKLANFKWEGPKGTPIDISNENFDIEVKSASRYGTTVQINGEYQLASEKEQWLTLVNLEESEIEAGEGVAKTYSIESVLRYFSTISDVLKLEIEDRLFKNHRLEFGMAQWSQCYILYGIRSFKVDESFPKIIPSSFVSGIIPPGIKKVSYEISLDNLPGYKTITSPTSEIYGSDNIEFQKKIKAYILSEVEKLGGIDSKILHHLNTAINRLFEKDEAVYTDLRKSIEAALKWYWLKSNKIHFEKYFEEGMSYGAILNKMEPKLRKTTLTFFNSSIYLGNYFSHDNLPNEEQLTVSELIKQIYLIIEAIGRLKSAIKDVD